MRTTTDGAFRRAESSEQGWIEATKNRSLRTQIVRKPRNRVEGLTGAIFREAVGIKIIVLVRLRLQSMEWCDLVRFSGKFEIEAIHQLIVCQGGNLNGESSLKSCDTRDSPAIKQLTFGPSKFACRQLPVVAEDKPMTRVERR